MKAPKIIQDIADKKGCNSVSFIGKRKGKDAFVMGYVEIIGGEEGLELL